MVTSCKESISSSSRANPSHTSAARVAASTKKALYKVVSTKL